MHIEHISLSRDQLKDILSRPDFIIPVGTTSCRTLESLYWLGVKHLESIHPLNHLEQWEAFRLTKSYSRTEALEAILNKMEGEEAERFEASTGIMITPGYEFQMTDALITNFHQPSSTLLMLIAALTGDDWKKIYNFALKNDYRFLSYGDSSLLFRNKRK
jgi:S-adenosylmethionine:tRNA ribosyltransferase-isomerase